MATEKRLIDANALVELFDEYICFNREEDSCVNNFAADVCEVLRDTCVKTIATVDAVEVVHGRWKEIEASDELYQCSACGEWQFIPEEHFGYCPYCGAKMDLKGE